ncbi:hypothetical protein FRB95_008548 [Tulasnella sp. JGI-2019a]|nr:hypothetical protein FRB95_008548 [Tulasnella sp. JGI-2019a]
MTQLTDGRPIFPNLLSLVHHIDGPEWMSEEPDMERWTPLLPLLVGPGLGELTLRFDNATGRVVGHNIQTLARIAPAIQTVVIENFTYAHSPHYCAFSQMRSLTVCGCFDHQTWRCLASCSRLESILLQDPDIDHLETQNYSVTFPYMKTLVIDYTVDWRDPEFVQSSLRCTTMPVLEGLEVTFLESDITVAEAIQSEVQEFMHRSPLLKEALVNGRVIRNE